MPKSRFISNRQNAFALFLVWPFFSVVYSLINYKSSYAKNIVWLFCGFFGYTFVFYTEGSDSAVYRNWFISLHGSSVSFTEYVINSNRTDYFNPSLQYLLSRFTDNYRILFLVYGLIFGYFYSRNIWLLVKEANNDIKHMALWALLLFVFMVPFWNINGVRFYTAAHVFFYGAAHFFIHQKTKYLLVSFLSMFVHFSFIIPVGVLVTFLILGDRPYVYLILLILTSLVINLEITTLLSFLPDLGEGNISNKVGGYTGAQYVEKMNNLKKEKSWFLVYRQGILTYILLFYSAIVIVFFRREFKDTGLVKLLYFGMLLLCMANTLQAIPSMHRFNTISYLFLSASLFLFVSKKAHNKWIRTYSVLTILPFLFYIIVEIRLGLQYIGLSTLFSNPLVTWVLEHKSALIDFYL